MKARTIALILAGLAALLALLVLPLLLTLPSDTKIKSDWDTPEYRKDQNDVRKSTDALIDSL